MNKLRFVVCGFMGLLVQNSFAQVNKKPSQKEYIDTNQQVIDSQIVTFVGTERLTIIQKADSTLVYELNPDDSLRHPPSELLEGFFITKKGRKLSNLESKGIKNQITQPKSYDFSGVYQLCAFSPVVAFEFYYQSQTVRLLLCFDCNDLMFFDAKGRTAGKSFEKASREWTLLVTKILKPKINRKK